VRDLDFHHVRAALGGALLVGLTLVFPLTAAETDGETGEDKAQDVHYEPYPIAVLRTLDKITGRAHTIEVPVDQATKFGTLSLTVKACYKRPPEETPEKAAFLIIYDEKPDEPPEKDFSGWMFASSPALSSLEHPVYDLWVLDCEMKMSKAPETQTETRN
jgi:hypothetical protein